MISLGIILTQYSGGYHNPKEGIPLLNNQYQNHDQVSLDETDRWICHISYTNGRKRRYMIYQSFSTIEQWVNHDCHMIRFIWGSFSCTLPNKSTVMLAELAFPIGRSHHGHYNHAIGPFFWPLVMKLWQRTDLVLDLWTEPSSSCTVQCYDQPTFDSALIIPIPISTWDDDPQKVIC